LVAASAEEVIKVGECPICINDLACAQDHSSLQEASSDDVDDAGPAVKTACGHIFHLNCIKTWTDDSHKLTCPCCRRVLFEDPFTMQRDLDASIARLNRELAAADPELVEFDTLLVRAEIENSLVAAAIEILRADGYFESADRDNDAEEDIMADVAAVVQSLAGNGPGFW
jgi:hypothetical protein